MTPSRPYLLRAIYEWLIDNHLTPFVIVDATLPAVEVPQKFVKDGEIILNIEPQAISHLHLGNEWIEFDAKFSGIAHHITVPMPAIKAIYASENGRGMVFSADDLGQNPTPPNPNNPLPKKSRPDLKIVK